MSMSAHTAAAGNAAGMMLLAAGVVGLGSAIGDGMRAAREESELDRYSDALYKAHVHVNQVTFVANEAIKRVRELEAQVASLKAACGQRQEVIDLLMGRG